MLLLFYSLFACLLRTTCGRAGSEGIQAGRRSCDGVTLLSRHIRRGFLLKGAAQAAGPSECDDGGREKHAVAARRRC